MSRTDYPRISLTKDLRESIANGHPWLFDRALQGLPKSMRPGQVVTLVYKGTPLALGFVDPGSQIALRILSLDTASRIDGAWVSRAASRAASMRSEDPRLVSTNAFRVIHGENDYMPGLVIDNYDGTGVLSFDGRAARDFWRPHMSSVVESIQKAGVRLDRVWGRPVRKVGGPGEVLYGDEPPPICTIEEYGCRFEVDVRRGQKTGFFLDQRENRKLVGELSGGRTVLNLFGYTGGFSVHAALRGAKRTTTVDLAAPAIEAAKRNFSLNGIDLRNHEFVAGDVFDYLEKSDAEPFDIVICDPPSFAPNKQARGKALAAYRRVNALAMESVRPGGLLIAASCSSHITPEDMSNVVASASVTAGRRTRIKESFGAGGDHPVRPGFVEGAYLKVLVVDVE